MPIWQATEGVVCEMNELLKAMSKDMGINRFCNEAEDSFAYRLCYSALGQWCLRTAKNSSAGVIGTTKHNQTIVLNELMARYSELFPGVGERLVDQQLNAAVHIRRVYEETGYLLTDDGNRNKAASFGRSIKVGSAALFFGVPASTCTVNGLGVFSASTTYSITSKEFLIRDDLTWEEYFQVQFDSIDFYNRDIDIEDIEFFNPLLNTSPSQSWRKAMETDCTIARSGEFGPFYKVRRFADNAMQFADEPIRAQNDSFTSYEYRRLYFALKAHYGSPLKAFITRQDAEYSTIRLSGHLPNREYYYLLLLSWPQNSIFDKTSFLIKRSLVPEISAVLMNLGIEMQGEDVYA